NAFHFGGRVGYRPAVSLPGDPSQIYLGGDPPEDPPRAAKHRLVRELKRAIDTVSVLRVTAEEETALAGFADEVRAVADRLDDRPSMRTTGGAGVAGLPDAALVERSPISGRSNPLAAPLHLEVQEGVTRGWAVWTDA